MDEPPRVIIDVPWRGPLAQLIADLNEVPGEPNVHLICACLFGWLPRNLQPTNVSLRRAVLQAMAIARAKGVSDLDNVLDSIDVGLHLAETQPYGKLAAAELTSTRR